MDPLESPGSKPCRTARALPEISAFVWAAPAAFGSESPTLDRSRGPATPFAGTGEAVASSHRTLESAGPRASSSAHNPRVFRAEWPRTLAAGSAVRQAQSGCVQRHTGTALLGSQDAVFAFRGPTG